MKLKMEESESGKLAYKRKTLKTNCRTRTMTVTGNGVRLNT